MTLNKYTKSEFETIWTEKECDENYVQGKKILDKIEGYMLFKIKKDLHSQSKTGWEEFCNRNDISKRTADAKIAYFTAQVEFIDDDVIQATIPHRDYMLRTDGDVTYEMAEAILNYDNELNNISYSIYQKLKGPTVEKKMRYYGEVQRFLGKDNPTRDDIINYNKAEKKFRDELINIVPMGSIESSLNSKMSIESMQSQIDKNGVKIFDIFLDLIKVKSGDNERDFIKSLYKIVESEDLIEAIFEYQDLKDDLKEHNEMLEMQG